MDNQPLLLVAEDDPDDQILLQLAIDAACSPGIVADFVWDGAELIDYLRGRERPAAKKPDLVLLDLNMPRKDGRTALKEIKADPSLEDVPVAVLTTSSSPDDAQFCQDCGVVGYYRKPSTETELVEIMRGLCRDYL
jgi:CheY-like chemotaxis protein